MNLAFLYQFVSSDKIGGWVRAGVAAAFVAAVAKWPVLGAWVDPAVETQIAAAIAAVAVGAWSHLTKTDAAKIAAVAALPDVEKIVVQPQSADGVGVALADSAQTKVVSQ